VGFLILAGAPGPGEIRAEETADAPPPGPDNVTADLLQLIREGQYSEAVDRGNEYLAKAEEKYGPDSVEVAAVLDYLVQALWRGGRMDPEVFALAERALAIRERELGPDDLETSASVSTLASLNWMVGNYTDAGKLYRRALGIMEARQGPDHPDVAAALNNLALTHYALREFAAARENLERALAIRAKEYGPEHPMLASTLMNLGVLLRDRGSYDDARGYFFRALKIIEKEYGPEHPDVGMIRVNIGTMYAMEGRYEEAVPLYEAGVDIAIKSLGPEHPDVARSIGNLGYALWYLGEIDRAGQAFERALALQEKTLGPDHIDLSIGLINYGFMLFEQRRYGKARPYYRRALEIRKSKLGREHFDTAEAMTYLAELSLGEGKFDEALGMALEAEGIARRQFQRVAASLTEQEALAFELVRKSGISLASESMSSLDGERAASAAARMWDQLIRSRAMVMDEIAFRRRTLAMHATAEVKSGLDTLALARDELAGLIASGAGNEEDFLERLDAAQSRRAAAERAVAEMSVEFRRRVDRREAGLDEVIAALPPKTSLVAYHHYSRIVSPTDLPASSAETAKEAKPVTKPVARRRYLAFVLSNRDSEPVAVSLSDADEIDTLIQEWKLEAGTRPPAVPLAARKAEARYREAGEALRRAVWDPVREAVDLEDRVLVVPDGLIHMVSLAALPSGGGYLVETGPALHYLSAERDLVRTGERREDSAGLLALGGADFDLAPGTPPATATRSADPARAASCDGLASMSFSPIHSSRAEAEQVTGLWREKFGEDGGEALLLTGKEATEASLRSTAPGHRVVHLATHGFFAQEACAPADPGDVGSRALYGTHDDAEASRVLEDPFLLAGLALAGANARTESEAPPADDGILTAEEIAAMDLTGVEWVVLSACETGVGKVQTGEGVLGLRRAFETAGARTLVMSLWAVDDEATRSWMEHLYRHRLAGEGTLDAVRAATVETIETRRDGNLSTHPFFWGAFVAVGDWR
jgi:CHAT domain-containing protein/Tfp pilus assembly protein PilF